MLQLFNFAGDADDRIESAWRARDWSTFVYLWLLTGAALGVFAVLVVFVPGVVFAEVSRVYHFFRSVSGVVAGMPISAYIANLYANIWNFAVAMGFVTLFIALISCIPIMLSRDAHLRK